MISVLLAGLAGGVEPAVATKSKAPSQDRLRYCHIKDDKCSNGCTSICSDHRIVNGTYPYCTQAAGLARLDECIKTRKKDWLVDYSQTP